MAFRLYIFLVAALAASCFCAPQSGRLPLVQSNQLRRVLTQSALRAHGKKFEDFAAASNGTRAFGTVGHNLTVDYIKTKLDRTGYYNVELQHFVTLYSEGTSNFSALGTNYSTGWFTYGPAGDVTAQVVPVDDLGCEPENYPSTVSGGIALISRGTCEFGLKVAYAGAAGAKGGGQTIIYNNVAGEIGGGTLSKASRPEGPYVPVGSISQEDGLALQAAATNSTVTGTLLVDATTENRTTTNILATTKGGDQNNLVFLGAHTDSVPAGPGINDNGSGSIGLLEIALQLPKWSVNNAVKFGWWTAEEFGLVGSEYYVASLSREETEKIALYINADMIASPNFGYFIYDGDGSAFNESGPAGSDHIEKLFEDYFDEVGLPTEPTEFDGRSDYGPFLDAGIPSGGLATGAEGIKTEAEAALWGGEAGVAYDVNYHQAGDTLANTNTGAWIQNTKALAHAAAVYARNLTGIPREARVTRRGVEVSRDQESKKRAAFGHVFLSY